MTLDPRVFESSMLESRRPSTTFSVDQLVDVAKRTQPGMCKAGGVARITSVSVSRSGKEHYDVSYVLGREKEERLPVSILQEIVKCAGRPRRSLEAASAGLEISFIFANRAKFRASYFMTAYLIVLCFLSAAEDSRVDRLQRLLDSETARHACEITNLRFHNSDLRRRLRESN